MAAVAVSAMLIGSSSDMEGVARGIRMGRNLGRILGERLSMGTSRVEKTRTLMLIIDIISKRA